MEPRLYMIAGANGSGKSTISKVFLPVEGVRAVEQGVRLRVHRLQLLQRGLTSADALRDKRGREAAAVSLSSKPAPATERDFTSA